MPGFAGIDERFGFRVPAPINFIADVAATITTQHFRAVNDVVLRVRNRIEDVA